VFGILLGPLSEAPRRAFLLDSCGHAYSRMLQLFPGISFPSYPHALPVAVAAGLAAGKAPSKADVLVPAVIDFVDGRPVTQQASVVEGPRLERFDWSGFMQTAEAAGPLGEEAARSAVVCALSTLRRYNRGGGDDLHILRGGELRLLRVVAARDIKKEELKIAPLVSHPMRIMAQCQQGWAPQVVVRRGGEIVTMYLAVTASFPASRQGILARSESEWATVSAEAEIGPAASETMSGKWATFHGLFGRSKGAGPLRARIAAWRTSPSTRSTRARPTNPMSMRTMWWSP
jgi:hypothetical protein